MNEAKLTGAGYQMLDGLFERSAVELVPMVSPVGSGALQLALVPCGPDYPREIVEPGCGLVRQPAGYFQGGGAPKVRNVWVPTRKDKLPCMLAGIGVVLEEGGPIIYTIGLGDDLPNGLLISDAGQSVTIEMPWPAVLIPK